jgi:SAM-dependent methyltransferase
VSGRFESEWRHRFERFARTHEEEALISGWSEAGLRRRVRVFQEILAALARPSPLMALDLGCGAGTYVRLLAGLGHHAVGLDYSLPSLGRALAADPGRKATYFCGEAYAVPFREQTFDLVACIGVLQTLASPEQALDEVFRVLRPGGVAIIEALNGRALLARTHRLFEQARGQESRVRVYNPAEVAGWLSARTLIVERRVPIWLPPRRLPALGRLLEVPPVARILHDWVALSDSGAHSFLFVARRRGSAR